MSGRARAKAVLVRREHQALEQDCPWQTWDSAVQAKTFSEPGRGPRCCGFQPPPPCFRTPGQTCILKASQPLYPSEPFPPGNLVLVSASQKQIGWRVRRRLLGESHPRHTDEGHSPSVFPVAF